MRKGSTAAEERQFYISRIVKLKNQLKDVRLALLSHQSGNQVDLDELADDIKETLRDTGEIINDPK